MPGSNTLLWLDSKQALLTFETTVDSLDAEATVSRSEFVAGYCSACGNRTDFQVCTGAKFGDRPNLREGLRCGVCRMTARQRSLVTAFAETVPSRGTARGLIMERWSPVWRFIRQKHPRAFSSEFLPGHRKPGRRYPWYPGRRIWKTRMIRHESITNFSFDDSSLDFIVHSDVLEHVEDFRAALRECSRVLKPGFPMLMTAPFFTALDHGLVRGRTDGSGTIVHLLPPEFHGDGLKKEGIYTFHNFGWDLYDELNQHFSKVQIGVQHSIEHGFLYADSVPGPFNMLPIVFRAYR